MTLTTVESDLTGFGPTTDTLHFTYTRALPQTLTVKRIGERNGHEFAERCELREDVLASLRLPVRREADRDARSRMAICGLVRRVQGPGACTVRMTRAQTVNARFVRN